MDERPATLFETLEFWVIVMLCCVICCTAFLAVAWALFTWLST